VTGPRPGIRGRRREDAWSQAEVDTLVRILREQGPLDARDLRRLAEARGWGPGRFGWALSRARRAGRVRRTGGRRYAAAD
jgi:hypothetical protein